MRKSLWIIPLVLLFGSIGAPNAHADSFTFAVTGAYSGTGTFTTNPLSGGTYLITEITGTFDGSAITSLISLGGFMANDNLLYPSIPFLDGSGVSFTLADGNDVNVCSFVGTECFDSTLAFVGTTAIGEVSLSVSPTATPEPSSIALMLAGIGLLLMTQKRICQRLPQAS